jgi:voltage-gated potassium channel
MAMNIATQAMEGRPLAVRIHHALRFWNNILLIPMFTIMVLEATLGARPGGVHYMRANLLFCASFLLEYALGLLVAESKVKYLKDPKTFVDLISSIPVGYFFQSLRAVRVVRIIRFAQVAWRARRFKGKGARLIRAMGVVGSIAFAGAIGLRIAEPAAVKDFSEALWWAVVTLSTVGYGDVAPVTGAGRAVATCLMIAGVGVFGFLAGFMASLMEDAEEDEILATVRRIEARLDAMG